MVKRLYSEYSDEIQKKNKKIKLENAGDSIITTLKKKDDDDEDYIPSDTEESSSDDSSSDETTDESENEENVHNKLTPLIISMVSVPMLPQPNSPIEPPKKQKTRKPALKCNNPLCNHKTFRQNKKKIIMPQMDRIRNIGDLITLGKLYHCKKNTEFGGINLRLLCNLVPPLTELQNLIGMKSVKESMVNQILFFLQGFNKKNKCGSCIDCAYNLQCVRNQDDMLHTIITGPPGVGKTELGKILGKVYKEMGILSKGHFTVVTRSDLIGKYLGHTAKKTQDKIDECIGGVMFIDEAYSLGHKEGRDSFSKECLDTLNQNLTEKRDLLVIIAGYESALETSFFNMNEGLKRRFTFRYDIEKYTPEELRDIFLLKVKKEEWEIEVDNNKLLDFFKDNHDKFPNFGGDIETLLLNCKIVHSRRILFTDQTKKRVLNFSDINEGYNAFDKNRKYKDDWLRRPPTHLFI